MDEVVSAASVREESCAGLLARTDGDTFFNQRSPVMSIDRSAVSRALAKAIAYKSCGKDADAASWARELVRLLECAEILREESR